MPKVLIMSDSHGLRKEVAMIKDRHKDSVDQVIHCGDSELDMDAPELYDFMKVAGNCDIDGRYPNEIDFSVQDLTFFVTHGHLFQVKTTLMPLSYRAEELGANVICFGHSHIAGAEVVKGRLFINPGSVRLPRGRKEPTYAILSWEAKQDVTVDFYDVSGDKIEEMTYQAAL
ncbi:metallophosphoesterase [Aquibacillus koreensis]|uniref:Phosphoesterase n=1 Tax=Aquibacillus koreensis TaxID=279446 RepID=A0A9X3WIL8_9BACI|nr:metallophosphoesterase [Aquibacillus koreensis]MCT2537919.1 metallophosphoesterase [Aquibacillus koreensis]MDC3419190.1 metallophosphoesterase [Aquibacillus koreensis]